MLQVIGPADRGGATAIPTIGDAFRSGSARLTYTGDLLLSDAYDGFDRVIQAVDPKGNYVDTGIGYPSNPFLDPDCRVIRSDDYGNVSGTDLTIPCLPAPRCGSTRPAEGTKSSARSSWRTARYCPRRLQPALRA